MKRSAAESKISALPESTTRIDINILDKKDKCSVKQSEHLYWQSQRGKPNIYICPWQHTQQTVSVRIKNTGILDQTTSNSPRKNKQL
jgi:hypothetical protein